MALLKHRPRIRVRLPREIHPGATFVAEIVLDCRRATTISSLTAELVGEETATFTFGNSRQTYRRPLLGLGARLSEERELQAGRTAFHCSFALPPDLPPSYRGQAALATYTLRVRAAVPWWLDRKADFWVMVKLAPTRVPDATPTLHSTAPDGPRGKEPVLELSLASPHVVGGGKVAGTVALYNTAFNTYRELTVALVSTETASTGDGKRSATTEAHRYQIRIPVEAKGDGHAAPFRMALPEDVPPSFRSGMWQLGWVVEVRADIAWSKDAVMRVPVQVHPHGSSAPERAPHYAPLSVGSSRIDRIWQSVGAQLGMRWHEGTLLAEVGEVTVQVRRDHRGNAGLFLVATLAMPSLKLGLDGGNQHGFHRFLRRGVALGDATWDRTHYVHGRDEAQVRALATALGLTAHRVADLSDEQLVLEHRDAGQSGAALGRFAGAALELAHRVPAARAAVPVPACMAHLADAWRDLARRLGGALTQADMSVVGRFDAHETSVTTEWSSDGAPRRTVVVMKTPVPVDEQHHLVWAEGVFREGGPDRLPGRAREALDALARTALTLAVDTDQLAVSLPAPADDARAVISRLEELAALAAALRSTAGPYR